LGVVVRSPAVLVSLAALAALWGFGAYQWLWLPESSGLLLLLALIWGIAQIAVAVGFLAGTTSAAVDAATSGAGRLELRRVAGFNRQKFWRCLAWGAISLVLLLVLSYLFKWSDDHALEVASFLTFRSEKAVSPVSVGKVFWVIQMVIWIIVGGFLLSTLALLLREGWVEARRQAARILRRCCWRAPFWSGLLSVGVFGSLAWLLATWHPKVSVGFSDYAQMLVRMGGALLLIISGWLFWLLSLARYNFPPDKPPTS
jgi:magnesium-transporting ATPase (P-type)